MGKIGLQLKATLENITNLRPVGEDFRWYLKMKCGNCGEISEKWQYLRLMDSAPLKGGRGSATMVQKCKLCSRENSIGIHKAEKNDGPSSQYLTSLEWFLRKAPHNVHKSVVSYYGKESIFCPAAGDHLHRNMTIDSHCNSRLLYILRDTIKPYNAEDSEKFKTIVEFECRGLEPVDFQPQAGFAAEGAESGTPFSEINLLEKDWNDYDEKIKESVGIYEVTHKFLKC